MFINFANAFFKITHPQLGLISYQNLLHHKELSALYENNDFVLVKKYRQGGFTTFSTLWCLWKCLTVPNFRVLFISNSDIESLNIHRIIKIAYENMLEKLECSRFNIHGIIFENESRITLGCNALGKGTRQDVIVFDEVAFYKDFKNHYKALHPCISIGKIFLVSTPNRKSGYFYELYQDAILGKNNFKVYSPSVMDVCSMDKLVEYYNNYKKYFLAEKMGEFLEES